MSEDFESAESRLMLMCCASCGIAANDDVKLKKCGACNLVVYCGVKCQRKHRPHHKRACKKRVAELREEILFRQPESSHLGDCHICFLPLPIDRRNSMIMPCCSNLICNGCGYANMTRVMEQSLEQRCLFCRHPAGKTKEVWKEEFDKSRMKRVEANDPAAIREVGFGHRRKGDNGSAFEYLTKAAELGDTEAHYQLSLFYNEGQSVEKDMEKAIYHSEQAAIGGHPFARHNLGCEEENNGRIERAVKHYIIAASLGDDDSLEP